MENESHELLHRKGRRRHRRGFRHRPGAGATVRGEGRAPRAVGRQCDRACRDHEVAAGGRRRAQLRGGRLEARGRIRACRRRQARFRDRALRGQQCRRHGGRHGRASHDRRDRVAARHQPLGRDLRHQGLPADDAGAARGLHRQHLERVRPGRLPAAERLQHLQVRRARPHRVPVERTRRHGGAGRVRAPGRHQDQHREGGAPLRGRGRTRKSASTELARKDAADAARGLRGRHHCGRRARQEAQSLPATSPPRCGGSAGSCRTLTRPCSS